MTTHPSSCPRRFFTLIELLVVVAIIGVLASMLLPTLAKAKFKAINTECASRQKQLATAIFMYEDEQDGYVPPLNSAGIWGYNYGTWYAPVAPYAGISNWNEAGKTWRVPDAFPYWCPENTPIMTNSGGFGHEPYAMNWRLRWRDNGDATTSHRLIDAERPTQIFMVHDAGIRYGDTVNQGWFTWVLYGHPSPNILPGRHKSQGHNVTYIDGHVEWMSRETMSQYIANKIPWNFIAGEYVGGKTTLK